MLEVGELELVSDSEFDSASVIAAAVVKAGSSSRVVVQPNEQELSIKPAVETSTRVVMRADKVRNLPVFKRTLRYMKARGATRKTTQSL